MANCFSVYNCYYIADYGIDITGIYITELALPVNTSKTTYLCMVVLLAAELKPIICNLLVPGAPALMLLTLAVNPPQMHKLLNNKCWN